jgi:hypothetical protein
MPFYRDVVHEAEDAEVFRQIARELYDLPHAGWTSWEEDIFLPRMLQRPRDYVYSEKERVKLAELGWFSEEIYDHDGIAVEAIIARCAQYSEDMGDYGEWIIDFAGRKATFVRRRQLRVLVSLYRLTGLDIGKVDRFFDRRELEPV